MRQRAVRPRPARSRGHAAARRRLRGAFAAPAAAVSAHDDRPARALGRASGRKRCFSPSATASGWRTLTYAAALDATRRVAQALLDRGCTPAAGVAILSENGIDHALLALAAQYAGIPYVPVSPPYSLLSTDFAKLRHVLALFAPALVYARDAARFARAFASDVVAAGIADRRLRGHARRTLQRTLRAAARRRRRRQRSMRRTRASRTTRSPRFSSPPARPACPKASSTRNGCCAATSR